MAEHDATMQGAGGAGAIAELAVLYLDNLLTAEQDAELRRLLAADADARRRFVAICMNAELVGESMGDADVAVVEPTGPFRFPRRVTAMAAAVLVVGAIAAAYIGLLNQRPSSDRGEVFRPVAVLMSADEVQWDSAPSAVGETIAAGRITIGAGSLEMESMAGATVRVTGPCDVEMLAADRLRVHRGHVSAKVDHGVSGFTVDAPHGVRVVDLGTAFDVTVDAEERVEVYVSEGRVRVDRPQLAGVESIDLDAGHGLLYAAGDSDTPIGWIVSSDTADGLYARLPQEAKAEGPWNGPANLRYWRIGFGGPGGDKALIAGLAFALPAGVAVDQIDRVELRLPLMALNGSKAPAFNVDVYGVGVRDEPRLGDSEFYVGGADKGSVRLANDVIKPTSKVGVVSVSDEAMTRYVRQAYDAAGKPRGRYLVLRLNADRQTTGFEGYVVAFRENESATQTSPRLILYRRAAAVTTAPVP